jgi:hypothetical protein
VNASLLSESDDTELWRSGPPWVFSRASDYRHGYETQSG